MLIGIYAPIKKPITALIMPISPESAASVRINPLINTVISVADNADNNIVVNVNKTSVMLKCQPPLNARYAKQIISVIVDIIIVVI